MTELKRGIEAGLSPELDFVSVVQRLANNQRALQEACYKDAILLNSRETPALDDVATAAMRDMDNLAALINPVRTQDTVFEDTMRTYYPRQPLADAVVTMIAGSTKLTQKQQIELLETHIEVASNGLGKVYPNKFFARLATRDNLNRSMASGLNSAWELNKPPKHKTLFNFIARVSGV